MIHLHPIQYQSYRALERLVAIYRNNQPLSEAHVEYFYWLGGEHSLCKETVGELLQDCLIQP